MYRPSKINKNKNTGNISNRYNVKNSSSKWQQSFSPFTAEKYNKNSSSQKALKYIESIRPLWQRQKQWNKDLDLSHKRDISSTSSDPNSKNSENCDENDNEFCVIVTLSNNK
jgi:hypothetical protein